MRRFLILSLATTACATSASAQTSDPYRNPWTRTGPVSVYRDADTKDPRIILRRFAKCTAAFHHDAARRYLLLPLGSWVPEKDYREITDQRCLKASGRLMMGQLAYRGALAEEMVHRDLAQRTIDPATAPRLNWSVPELPSIDERTGRPLAADAIARREKARDIALAESLIGQLGECLVREAPSGSLAVLGTRTSDAEKSAFEALAPAIAGCIRKGSTLTFTRANLRSAIALSYYRLASASAVSAQQRAVK